MTSTHDDCAPIICCRPVTTAVSTVAAASSQFPVEQQIDGTGVIITKLLCHFAPWRAGGSPIAAKPAGLSEPRPLRFERSCLFTLNRDR